MYLFTISVFLWAVCVCFCLSSEMLIEGNSVSQTIYAFALRQGQVNQGHCTQRYLVNNFSELKQSL